MADYPSDGSAISLESTLDKIEQLENENIQLAHDLEECRDQLFDCERYAHEASRSSNKPQKKNLNKAYTIHRGQSTRVGTMPGKAGDYFLGRLLPSPSSKASHSTPPNNEGKQSIGPGGQKELDVYSDTYSPTETFTYYVSMPTIDRSFMCEELEK